MNETLKTFEIWSEGYAMNGDSGHALLMSTSKGKNFLDACRNYFAKHPSKYYDPNCNTWWGCKLFDNETDARRSFG